MKTASSQITPAGLYIIATPIGNLADISFRALDILKLADLILCEDTRVSGKLLSHYGIKKPLLSYNDHNASERRPEVMAALRAGQHVALISDAGTPLVSDPGYKLVREVLEQDIYVTAIPGASSVMAALCLSGLPSDRFLFAGFLPAKAEALKKELVELATIPATLIFFESARRLEDALAAMHAVLGNREVAVVRELTKLYEESKRGSLDDLIAYYKKNGEPKGEVVIVVAPPAAKEANADDVEAQLALLLKSHSVKEAASILAEQTGKSRKEIYALALKMKE